MYVTSINELFYFTNHMNVKFGLIITAHHFQIRSQRQSETEKECHSFSLIYANGEHSLDLVIFVIFFILEKYYKLK